MVHELDVEVVGTRARRRAETTARVLDAAMALLARDGYDGLTMHALARALGYTVGALYRYFPSREALFVAAQVRVLDALRAVLAAEDARLSAASSRWGAEVRALASLLLLARVYGDFAVARPASWHLLAVSVGDPRELVAAGEGAEMVSAVGALLSWCAARFDAGLGAGALEGAPGIPSARRAVLYWSAVHGTLQLRKLGRFGLPGADAGALVDEAAQTMLRGWGADPSRVREAARRVERMRGTGPCA